MSRRLLLKNPMTIWARWLFLKSILEFKNRRSGLKLGYLAFALDCQFGRGNSIGEYCSLTKVSLGDWTYTADRCRLSNMSIGKFCSIGPKVTAGLGKHPSKSFVSTHPIFYSTIGQVGVSFVTNSRFEEYSPITIGNDVWIGAGAILIDGIAIGDGAIVGAGAVVTHDVPPYAVAVGVPARIVRYRFATEEIEYLLQMKWWDRDLEWLRRHSHLFLDVTHLRQDHL